MEKSNLLVNAEWLKTHLTNENLVIVDCQWDSNAYLRAHIPGALMRPGHPYIKSEIDGEVFRFLPDEDEFTEMMNKLGISHDTLVICYDEWSNHFATRFWWVARYYGHTNVKLLDGGWQAWVSAGLPVSFKNEAYPEKRYGFAPDSHEHLNIKIDEVIAVVDDPEWQILDVRSDDEYVGKNLAGNKRGGHIKDAIHLEWNKLLTNPEQGAGIRFFMSPDQMRAQVETVGIDREKNIAVHCQSGVRASFMVFCLYMLGYSKVRLYDGSMGEWANSDNTELVK